jgi:hypothetical protein
MTCHFYDMGEEEAAIRPYQIYVFFGESPLLPTTTLIGFVIPSPVLRDEESPSILIDIPDYLNSNRHVTNKLYKPDISRISKKVS